MAEDPGELCNLASAQPDTMALLRSHLDALLDQYSQASLGLSAQEVVDPEVLRRLRALGYIQ